MPHNNTHGRERLDFDGYINEAVFEPAELERDHVVQTIADELGLPIEPIDTLLIYQVFAPGGSWEESRQACLAYISANYDDWELPD